MDGFVTKIVSVVISASEFIPEVFKDVLIFLQFCELLSWPRYMATIFSIIFQHKEKHSNFLTWITLWDDIMLTYFREQPDIQEIAWYFPISLAYINVHNRIANYPPRHCWWIHFTSILFMILIDDWLGSYEPLKLSCLLDVDQMVIYFVGMYFSNVPSTSYQKFTKNIYVERDENCIICQSGPFIWEKQDLRFLTTATKCQNIIMMVSMHIYVLGGGQGCQCILSI